MLDRASELELGGSDPLSGTTTAFGLGAVLISAVTCADGSPIGLTGDDEELGTAAECVHAAREALVGWVPEDPVAGAELISDLVELDDLLRGAV